jgi:hypothetical protein
MADWRASQKLWSAEKTDPSLLFAVGVMRSVPAALGSGCRSCWHIDSDLQAKRRSVQKMEMRQATDLSMTKILYSLYIKYIDQW